MRSLSQFDRCGRLASAAETVAFVSVGACWSRRSS